MQANKQWYLHLRAEALATVFLTNRPDVQIDKHSDRGVDFVVYVTNPQSGNRDRLFAVEVKFVDSSSPSRPTIPTHLRRTLVANFIESTMPVCLFYFTMQDEHAWWQWIIAPEAGEGDGHSVLSPAQDSNLRPLDEHQIDQIVDEVNHWYDARRRVALARAA